MNHYNNIEVQRLQASRCDLHPNETFTGFCASCLRERLQGLEASAIANTSAGRKSTSALKSVFFKLSGSSGAGAPPPPPPPQQQSFASSFLRPELRRCKSFSFGRAGAGAGAFEPQRRSCDVRTTLQSLFHQDDQARRREPAVSVRAEDEGGGAGECRNPNFLAGATTTVPENRGELEDNESGDDEIRAVEPVLVVGTSGEIEEAPPDSAPEDEKLVDAAPEIMPMKAHIDQQQHQSKRANSKDLKEIAGSFWLAASVFSKKLQNWRRKQKMKKHGGSKAAAAAMPVGKPPKSSRRFGDTQSEVAVDAFGRRSCDTDPRFSLDAGRFSFDDPRFSWDEPRASWDGYLIGGRSVFPRLPPMLSVVEDAPAPIVQRSDGLIPVEEDVVAPGGTTQTRDYYLDSSSRRRRSLDRSSSVREQPVEFNEPRPVCNGKVTPAGGAEMFHCHHGGFVDRDIRDWSSNSLRDEYLGSFEPAFEDPFKGSDRKKSRRWSKAWNIWGFLQRRTSNRNANVVDRSFSESWTDLQSQNFSGKMSRSNSSVSYRNSFSGSIACGSTRNRLNTNGHIKKRNGEFVLERNRSAKYSPNQNDNSMLRFYLPPMRNSRRNGFSGNSRQISSNYLSKSMLGLY